MTPNRPVDPAVRLSLAFDWVRKERRLVVAMFVGMIVFLSAFLWLNAPASSVWHRAELNNMQGLPLRPDVIDGQKGQAP